MQNVRHVDSAHSLLPEHEGGALRSYEINPKGVRFATQDPYEKIFIIMRSHFLVNIGWVITSIIMFFIPLGVVALIGQFNIDVGALLTITQQMVVALIYYSFFLSYVYFNFVDWYYDIYLITNQRALDYEFSPLTSVHVFEMALEDLQDIKASKIGFLPNIFGYGNVILSSASRSGKIEFHAVARPSRFRDLIGDLTVLIRKTGHTKVHDPKSPEHFSAFNGSEPDDGRAT
ncbi:MAG TPA: PH domain-containing protein [bacterium]|nr:PH domain-containing protein [bacterium]